MAKINILFDGENYSIDKYAISSSTEALKTHLSTAMNGTGATINLDGTTYNVDSTKLANATNNFVSYLETISGSGSKITIGGIEYSVDSAKLADAKSALAAHLEALEDASN